MQPSHQEVDFSEICAPSVPPLNPFIMIKEFPLISHRNSKHRWLSMLFLFMPTVTQPFLRWILPCLVVVCVETSCFMVSWHKQDNIQPWLHKVMWKAFGSIPKFLLFKHEEAGHFCIPAFIYRNWMPWGILPFKLSRWCKGEFLLPVVGLSPVTLTQWKKPPACQVQ